MRLPETLKVASGQLKAEENYFSLLETLIITYPATSFQITSKKQFRN